MFVKLLFCVIFLVAFGSTANLPKYIKACRKNDKDFTKCALKSAKEAIPHILKGDRKYGIPNLNPLKLPQVVVKSGDNFAMNFKDLEVYGLENAQAEDIKFNHTYGFITLFIKHIELIGDYSVKGKILVLPIQGEGRANITIRDGYFSYSMDLGSFDKNGITYATVNDDKLEYKVKQAYINLDNLFNGDKKLGDAMNTFLNENWQDILNELGGTISTTISTVCRQIIQNYFKKVPLNELLP